MNKRIISAIVCLLALVSQVSAEDKVTISDFVISAGETKELSITLENEVEYAGFQFNLYLPEGLTVSEYSKNQARIPENTSLSMAKQKDGSYLFIAAAMSTKPIAGTSGGIVTIKITASEDLASGSLTGYFRRVKLSDKEGAGKTYEEMTFPITILEPSTVTAKSYEREYGEANPEFEYEVTGGALDGTPEITCEATKESPAGTYDIIVKRGTETNYNVTYVKGTLTIAAKTVSSPTITLSQTSYIFDGSEKKPTVTVADGETTIPSEEYTVSYSNNTNVGTATVTITDKAGGNYIVSGSATFAITAADGSLTPPTGKTGLTYTGAAQDLITAGSSTTGTLQYSLDGTIYGTTIPKGTDAKDYTVYYKVVAKAGYKDVEPASFKVAIAPKTVSSPTITLSQANYTYDGTAKEPTVTVKDGSATIPDTEYTVSYSDNTNVGTVTVTITDKTGGNYNVSGSTTFDIVAADGNLTPPAGKTGLTYSGAAQDLITAGSSTTGTMQYSLDGTNYGTTIPKGTDAKEYTIYYKVVASAGYKDVAPASFKVTIAKAPLKIKAGTYTRKQGEENPEFTLEYEGFKNDETEDVLTKKPTVTTTATKDSPAGEYPVTVSGAVAANYEITYVDGMLTVVKKKGDVNGDGDVNQKDINTIVSYLYGDITDGFDEEAADANGDKVVNVADIVEIVKMKK